MGFSFSSHHHKHPTSSSFIFLAIIMAFSEFLFSFPSPPLLPDKMLRGSLALPHHSFPNYLDHHHQRHHHLIIQLPLLLLDVLLYYFILFRGWLLHSWLNQTSAIVGILSSVFQSYFNGSSSPRRKCMKRSDFSKKLFHYRY